MLNDPGADQAAAITTLRAALRQQFTTTPAETAARRHSQIVRAWLAQHPEHRRWNAASVPPRAGLEREIDGH